MSKISSSLAAFGLAILASSASAVTVLDGTVEGPNGSWGFVDFYFGGGDLAIDAWANGFTKGPTGSGIEDIYLSLFRNNGSARSNFTGSLVGYNDDGYSFGDGSSSGLDSFLNSPGLSAGYYTLAISRCCNNFSSVRNENILGSGLSSNRDYRLTFSQDVALGEAPPPIVPIVVPVTGSIAGPSGSWGFIDFTHNGGSLSINALARDFTGGPTGRGIDDIYLGLFARDGSPRTAFTGALIASNDDSSAPGAFEDGSTSILDSFLNFEALNAGDYMLVIGHCCNRFEYYRNENLLYSGVNDGFRDYKITFKGDVVVAAVPEPEALALSAAGLFIVAAIARKRKKQEQAA